MSENLTEQELLEQELLKDWESDWIDRVTLKFLKDRDHDTLKAKWQVFLVEFTVDYNSNLNLGCPEQLCFPKK